MGLPGYGFDYPGVCDYDACAQWGTHVHESKRYCKLHYRKEVQGYSDCPGCRNTGRWHDNGQPHPSKGKCPLCKGEGCLAP